MISLSVYSQYKNIFGSPYMKVSAGYNGLNNKIVSLNSKFSSELESVAKRNAVRQPTTAGINLDAIKKELSNSASQILNFANLNAEQVKDFSALMIKLKGLKNPLDSDPDIRKICRNITKTYYVYKTKSF